MSKRFLVLMCSVFLIVPLVFMGCGGSDGAQGPQGIQGNQGNQGIQGDEGPQGPAGPVTTTNESCMVCHTTGRIADVSDSATTGMHYNAAYNNLPMAISNISITDNGSGYPQVTFHVASGATNLSTFARSNFRFYAADLVPAGTVVGESTDQFARWASESSGGTFDNSDAANGNYTYTFATAFGGSEPLYDSTHTQRLVIRASLTGYNGTVGIVDFDVADTVEGSTTGIGYNKRQFVTAAACQKCHSPLMLGAAHGSSYVDTKACIVCHSRLGSVLQDGEPLGEFMVNEEAWLAALVHKIHGKSPDGVKLTVAGFPNRIHGQGYGAVTYPQEATNCVTCHTNSGLDLGAGDLTSNWKDHPTAAACTTCHTNLTVLAGGLEGTGHAGGPQPDTFCSACHPANGHIPSTTLGASVTDAHDTSATSFLHANAKNAPEFDVTLTLSAPANESYYVAGEVVAVTATLNFHGGAAVPGTLYTSARGANGVTDNLLRTASLYVYGPRAIPRPLLASQATTLFVSTTDTNVATDTGGFKYNVTVPSGLANGTYMVRVRFADYGYVSDTDYKLESVAFQTIQIGTATESLKVSGNACTDCHGTTVTAPFHDARHVVAWDTDECVSCHDYSGGHAATLSNRVHAVHSSNSYGDMVNPLGETTSRDWSDVTWPLTGYASSATGTDTKRYDRCVTCHTSGNTSYRSVVGEVSCLGCHGDDPNPSTFTGGATNHMLQNGGRYPAAAE